MNRRILAIGVAIIVAGGIWYVSVQGEPPEITGGAQPGDPIVEVKVPADLNPQETMGKTAFEAKCAACHGQNATGRVGMGPPFVHPVYRPGHHADFAFVRAVEQGVASHHWPFGDMPKQEGLTRADIGNIVAYIRRVQRENGIN